MEGYFQAGSLRSILYECGHVIDEIIHALPAVLNDRMWAFRFCQWAHRYDDLL